MRGEPIRSEKRVRRLQEAAGGCRKLLKGEKRLQNLMILKIDSGTS